MNGLSSRAEAVRAAAEALGAAGVEGAARDARLLVRWACGVSAAGLAAAPEAALDAEQAARLAAGVARRAGRAPLSHVTGRRAFWGREFEVTPDVLDPRPETETLIALALERGPAARVLDLGVGSGAILLTLLAEWPQAAGVGVDASPAALAVARRNSERLGVSARAAMLEGDWLAGLSGRFDLIVSNPPYLRSEQVAAAAPELSHEPRLALDGGADGLDPYRRIAAAAPAALAPGGAVLVEFGAGQGEAAASLFRAAGFGAVRLAADLDGRPRALLAACD
ncbi:peptide chain release factor N(5)-glutamine methyltransferase [Rubrimonas cliftonensis]|uniref:Release factor glutamine methyltransferase n=1 Tax=Rubrimonas cliftonensis TaxID=89524 RepID=A0A1H3W2B1_9RHOB|nr:peptide chain release factor N(5)-glutamine methyltransferase [Rubrimonas cliftonensis]SDZ80468.1 [protein release factor]-glutamine N5-methyltransferase [Rubrimonas cliftonensis]